MPKKKKSNKSKAKSIEELTKNFDKFEQKEITKKEFDEILKQIIIGKRKKPKS